MLGRARQAALLDTAVTRTLDSHGGLVFVTGEAGIGKTVLVAEAAATAERRGALVATGTCWDREDAPSYWPWMQILRGLRRTMTPEAWADAAGGEIAALLGETGGPAASGDGFGLHDAVTTLLVTAARGRPLVVVLDDLHWADPPSVRLLEFVTRHAWFEQLLVIGVYRDVEVESCGHPLGPLLLPLLPKASSVTLTELGPDDVRALLARTAGREPSRGLVAEVHRRTGGNPFFVEQTARLWHSTNSVDVVAPGVRDAVERRLGLLPAPVVELLAAAAVLGPEFDREVLAEMTGRPGREVNSLLAEAVSARLVVPRAEQGRLAFVHDLVRETLYENLAEADARRWHAAAVGAFEALPACAARAAPGETAHHAYLGVPEVAASTAVALLRAAADDAWGRMASGEASVHLTRALRLVPPDDAHEWAAVALDLGSSQHHMGDEAAALRTFHDVAAAARSAGDPVLLVRAALRLRASVWLVHPPEAVRLTTDLINEAHAALFDSGGHGGSDVERERELTARAVEIAREAGDDVALMEGLMARHDTIWSPGTAVERLAIAEELGAAAQRKSDHSVMQLAALLRAVTSLELGDPAGMAELEDRATADPSSTALWTRTAFATLTGRFDEAGACIEQADEIERDNRADVAANGDLATLRIQQRWTLELARGRFDAADALVRSAAGRDHPCPELLLAVTAVERGDIAAASRLAARGGGASEPVSRWYEPLWLRLRAQLAAAGGDPSARGRVRAELAPIAGQWLTMFGASIDGPVVFWTALLDAADGNWDAAAEGFTAARSAADRLGARPWSVRARCHLAEVLNARAGPGDAERAAALTEAAARDAHDLGVAHLLRAEPEVAESPGDTFRFDGQVWWLTYEGVTVHVPDAKGLRDLHVLLGRPGKDVPAADLLFAAGDEPARGARRLGSDPVLDERAKSAYRKRLTQLDERIDAALAQGADARAAELDREREALLTEIRRATGLLGRSRRLGDATERTRKAVTERIRNSLRRLDDRHPALAEHLRQCVSTGSTCRYDPPGPVRWAR
ncbi:AAA family ATPase [Lentzea tibetensis]|uniref:AAA family ATPase n=1 Tax=Lentzea tibetensis TaxID=2591470 RepID=A0A563ES85_9PSEU|nr:AAA family ATPase [Lentzea tibetensis]